MNIEVFAEWHRRQGFRIIQSPSSYWYGQDTRPFNAFPDHILIQPSDEELRDLHLHEGILFLRYSKPLHRKEGKISYHIVYEGAPYDPQRLSAKTRQKVRQGQKHCQVERISLDRLAKEGWLLQQDSLERQGRLGSMSQQEWQQICRAAFDLPGFEAWGALVDNELAASIFAAQVDDTCHLLYRNGRREFFQFRVNNVLSYAVSQDMLSRPGVNRMFDGMHQLDSPASLDDFKLSMGYQIKPVRQRIKAHPWLSPVLNQYTYTAIKKLHQRYPHNHLLSKTEGILHFYLDGKRPPDQQEWPLHLLPLQETLLAKFSSDASGVFLGPS